MFAILLNNFMVILKLKDLVLYITIIASYIISRNGSLLRDDYHTIDIIARHCFEPWLSQAYDASLTASTAVV